MSLLGFRKEFAPAVESGAKRQTIRNTRKDIYPGKALQLYVGLRTKSCRKLLAQDQICYKKTPICIPDDHTIILDGQVLMILELERFARADGFACAKDLFHFVEERHGLPFGMDERGAEVIYW